MLKTHPAFFNNETFPGLLATLADNLRVCWIESTSPKYHWMVEPLCSLQLEHRANLLQSMAGALPEHNHTDLQLHGHEQDESLLATVLTFLEDQGVLRDEGETVWRISLLPEDDYVYVRPNGPRSYRVITKDVQVQKIRLAQEPNITGWIEVRRKSLLSQWMKITRLSVGQTIPDIVGIRIVLDCDYDSPVWHAGVSAVTHGLAQKMWRQASSGSASVDRNNSFHCHRAPISLDGELTDVQILPIKTAVNTRLSLRGVNDRFYRQRRLERFRERLFPKDLFGVNWNDPNVKDLHHREVLRSLIKQLEDNEWQSP
jgi:hypothetical protein